MRLALLVLLALSPATADDRAETPAADESESTRVERREIEPEFGDEPTELREPQDSYTVSLDPNLSLETGAHLTRDVATLFGALEARVTPFIERGPAAVPIRLVRTALLDYPLATWLVILQHEAFGHGGRAREFGSTAEIHMGSPWGGRDSYASFTTSGLSTDDFLRIYTGGSESNGWSATLLEREIVAGRPMRSFELIYMIRSRFVVSQYVLFTTPDPEDDPVGFYGEWLGGGDVANYLGYLNERNFGDAGITPTGASSTVVDEYRRLERQAYWNALDPGLWIAAWTVVRRAFTGDELAPLPLPRIGGRPFLPILTADWLPSGGVISIESVFGRKDGSSSGPSWFSFTARRGSGPEGPFGALGAATERFWESRRYRLGGEAELWNEPDGDFGGGARLRLLRTAGAWRGIFLDVGAKSRGHWPGRPAESGVFVQIGLYSSMVDSDR